MPRRRRATVAGYPMHVILRGIDLCPLFFSDDDNRYFIAMLEELASAKSVAASTFFRRAE